MGNKEFKVKFKVTNFADSRASNSSLEIGNIYEGNYRASNNSIWWKDPQNEQEWVFWVGDTCELIDSDSLEDIVKGIYEQIRLESKGGLDNHTLGLYIPKVGKII